MTTTEHETMSIDEALLAAFTEFTMRFGEELLWQSFAALMRNRTDVLQYQSDYAEDLDTYIGSALYAKGANIVIWNANARADIDQAEMLLHIGVRWWLARDDLLGKPAEVRVLKYYLEGLSDHFSLQLLSQMLFRGAAPETIAFPTEQPL